MNYLDLSKEISYALRHAPHDYGLCLDKYGYANVDVLISTLREQERFKTLTLNNIEKMIQTSSKKRHEIHDGKIRALYGHSFMGKMVREIAEPPDILYHGTSHKFTKSIFAIGLVSMDRQYVHLSKDVNTAITVGKRKDDNPVILKIDTRQAWSDGIMFYLGNENIWLADDIPAKYISLL